MQGKSRKLFPYIFPHLFTPGFDLGRLHCVGNLGVPPPSSIQLNKYWLGKNKPF